MRLQASAAVVGTAAVTMLALTAGGSAAAAASYQQSGNFQFTAPAYWCDHGHPSFAFFFRTLSRPEAKVTTTATGFQSYVRTSVAPYTSSQLSPIGATRLGGTTIVVTTKGSSSRTGFTLTATVPRTCSGLPTKAPAKAPWPTATPTSTGPASTSPASTATHVVSGTSPVSPTSSTSVSSITTGPPVITDGPTGDANATTILGLGLIAVGAATVGGVAVRRTGRR